MKTVKLAITLLFCLGALNALAAGDFDSLRGASAKQALEDSLELPDFPPQEDIPTWPAIPLPWQSIEPEPFFTGTCMMYCPFGYNYSGINDSCACREHNYFCENVCGDPSLPPLGCDCTSEPTQFLSQPTIAIRFRHDAADYTVNAGILASLLESTATIVCGGVEYSLFAFPMNCSMESVIPVGWHITATAYYASEMARARQPRLKKEAIRYFTGTGNDAAATAVEERGSRIFSDGTALFVAGAGKVAKIQDKTAARRVHGETFPRAGAETGSSGLGVHPAVVSGVLSCMVSDACWTGLPLSRK